MITLSTRLIAGLGRAAVALALLAVAAPATASAKTTEYKGAMACNDRGEQIPLAGARVELRRRVSDFLPYFFDPTVGVMRTDDEGGFSSRVTTDSTNKYYVRVVLRGDGVAVSDFIVPWASFVDLPVWSNRVAVRDYGRMVINNYRCQAFTAMHTAFHEFTSITGERPPTDVGVVAAAPNAGVPWTNYTDVYWPSSYMPDQTPGGIDTMRHEFAHTFRHAYDGDRLWFWAQVMQWNYARHHSACKRTNRGFAFNEGWAEYWASNERVLGGICAGTTPLDTVYEGNVATRLRTLQDTCGVTKKQMVDVLKLTPAVIHTLDQYRRRFEEIYGCSDDLTGVVKKTPRPEVELTRKQQLVGVMKDLASDAKLMADLSTRLGLARDHTRRLTKCDGKPCPWAVELAVKPITLGGQLAQARLLRRALRFRASPRQHNRMAHMGPRALARLRAAKTSALANQSLQIARRTARKAIAAAQKFGGADHPLAAALQAGAAQLTAGATEPTLPGLRAATQRAGPSPEGMIPIEVVDGGGGGAPDRNPAPAPAPAPVPSELALDCHPAEALWYPDYTGTGPSLVHHGTLTPGAGGSTVRVTYARPSTPPLVHDVTTGADGSFVDTVPIADHDIGTWTVTAEFAGDRGRSPTRSTPCYVSARYPDRGP